LFFDKPLRAGSTGKRNFGKTRVAADIGENQAEMFRRNGFEGFANGCKRQETYAGAVVCSLNFK